MLNILNDNYLDHYFINRTFYNWFCNKLFIMLRLKYKFNDMKHLVGDAVRLLYFKRKILIHTREKKKKLYKEPY